MTQETLFEIPPMPVGAKVVHCKKEPPRPVPLKLCIKCGQPAVLRSPSGTVYCQKHGYCRRRTCLKNVEKFVMHPRMGTYVCPCVLEFEQKMQNTERSASQWR